MFGFAIESDDEGSLAGREIVPDPAIWEDSGWRWRRECVGAQ